MAADYQDDQAISNDAKLLRWIRPDVVVRDPKSASGWRLSSQAFEDSRDGTPCSVAIESETWSHAEILDRFPSYGIAALLAGDARAVDQKVLRWPTDEIPGHAYIAGRKPKSVLNALAKAGRWVAGGRNWDATEQLV